MSWSATCVAKAWSSPAISIGPAAEAVVTVTLDSPKARWSGPRAVSTVWMRDIGATRHSCHSQPLEV